jgi:hypothetical protein
MTYDQWKCTDPREYQSYDEDEVEPEEDADDWYSLAECCDEYWRYHEHIS